MMQNWSNDDNHAYVSDRELSGFNFAVHDEMQSSSMLVCQQPEPHHTLGLFPFSTEQNGMDCDKSDSESSNISERSLMDWTSPFKPNCNHFMDYDESSGSENSSVGEQWQEEEDWRLPFKPDCNQFMDCDFGEESHTPPMLSRALTLTHSQSPTTLTTYDFENDGVEEDGSEQDALEQWLTSIVMLSHRGAQQTNKMKREAPKIWLVIVACMSPDGDPLSFSRKEICKAMCWLQRTVKSGPNRSRTQMVQVIRTWFTIVQAERAA
jgi:hypothetical protein